MELKGIDVSRWNGDINWTKVKSSGIEFVMIKAASGSNKGTYSLDPKFKTNIVGAYNAGLKVGVYLYSYAQSVAGVLGEAKFFVEQITPYKKYITYPAVYDLEDASQIYLGKRTLTEMVRTFCNYVRDNGFTPMLYSNPNWLKNYIDSLSIGVPVWLAQWASKPTWNGDFTMWQYSSKGSVPGISGNVDMNIGYYDYAGTKEIEEKSVSDWAKEAWNKAKDKGIFDGTNPQNEVTREQLAVILDRLNLYEDSNKTVVPPEASSSWATEAWTKAYRQGILDGTKPQETITRETLAVIIDRIGLLSK